MRLLAHLVIVFSVLMLGFASPIWATPTISGSPWAITENFGPNTAGFTEGHAFHVGAVVEDPLGVPGNIDSVNAVNADVGQPSYKLPFLDIGSIITGLYEVVPKYTTQMGQWEVTVENKQGETVSKLTNVLDDVHVLPLAANLQVTGSLLAPTITWESVLFDHDNDVNTPDEEVDNYQIRLLNSAFDQFYRSDLIYGNSFTVPVGLIEPGVTYIRLMARDLDDGALENRSSTFTQFTVPVPEPASIILVCIGILGIAVFRKKFKMK